MKPRIVLSVFAVPLMVACSSDDTSTPTVVNSANITAPAPRIYPCGLWIADDEAAAVARYKSAPTNPDMVQLTLPGGLSCAALIAAVSAVEANRGTPSEAIVMPILAPGVVADLPSQNGIGTSPNIPDGPQLEGSAKTSAPFLAVDDTNDPDMQAVCTRWETLPCGYLLGRTIYCRMCVCEELPGCHGNPMCAGCAPGF